MYVKRWYHQLKTRQCNARIAPVVFPAFRQLQLLDFPAIRLRLIILLMNHPSCSNGGPNLRVFKFVKFQITQLYLNICTASTNSLLRGRKGYLIVSYVIIGPPLIMLYLRIILLMKHQKPSCWMIKLMTIWRINVLKRIFENSLLCDHRIGDN